MPPGGEREPFVLASRAGKIALGITLVIAAGIGFLPQFAGPGYESALLLGILMPSVVILSMATLLARSSGEPFDAYCRGVGGGIVLFAAAFVVTLLHGLRAGLCDISSGTINLLLGPGVGMALAGAYAVVVAEIARRVRRGFRRGLVIFALGLAGPLTGIVVSVARFYTSPMIFAYDPFVGYFSGTLYDTVIDLGGLATYRIGTALTLLAGFFLTLHLARTARGRLIVTSIGRPGLLLLGIVSALASLGYSLEGARFDHFHTRASITEALGASVTSERCEIIYDRRVPSDYVFRFARECDGHVAANEAWIGVTGSPRLTAFLFRDERQKQRLMGAAGTNIAKPWRNEVYVQVGSFPHRVLGHEVMHVVAGGIGRGPFRIAAEAGGLWPNPGLIEGIAVASNPKEEELEPADWAKAMKDLGLLPKVARLFAMGFLGESSSTAYTASGAFVGYVHDRFGADAVRRWYGGEALEAVTGTSLDALETAWHAALDERAIPEAAMIRAKARFDKPGLFKRRCPRVVDACTEKSDELARQGDATGAARELDRALELEPDNPSLLVKRARAELAIDPVAATEMLKKIAGNETLAVAPRDAAKETLADRALQTGDLLGAKDLLQEILPRTHDDAKARTMEVKLRAVQEERLRPALVTLLIGDPKKTPDRGAANVLLGNLEETLPDDGLASYLVARYFLEQDDFEGARRALDRAIGRKLTPDRVLTEAHRLRIIVACALFDVDGAEKALAAYRAAPSMSPARASWLAAMVERTRRTTPPAPAEAPR